MVEPCSRRYYAVQAFHNVIPRADLLHALLPLAIVGVALIALAPAKQSGELTPASGA
jgi:hypothetical protein